MFISSVAEASLLVAGDLDIVPLILHMGIDLVASIPLPELNSFGMSCDNFDDGVEDADLSWSLSFILFPPMLVLVVTEELQLKVLLEKVFALV